MLQSHGSAVSWSVEWKAAVAVPCAPSTVVYGATISADRCSLPSVLQSHCSAVSWSVEWKAAVAVACALSTVGDAATISAR